MKYKKVITLKDGSQCLLQNAAPKDAQKVMDSYLITHSETDYLTSYPDERCLDVEAERIALQKRETSENEIELCAWIHGELAGTAGVYAVGNRSKLRHRASFGISVEKRFWGRGIGRALTQACVECARSAGYAQLELEVVGNNTAAIALYKSVGFREYGRNPKGFYSRLTGWQELVLMRLELE